MYTPVDQQAKDREVNYRQHQRESGKHAPKGAPKRIMRGRPKGPAYNELRGHPLPSDAVLTPTPPHDKLHTVCIHTGEARQTLSPSVKLSALAQAAWIVSQ